ncbi:MAG: hypothetical protein AB8B91_19230 [Rubripirellula sp.]
MTGMLIRFTHYIVSLVFLGCLAVVYQNIIAPQMMPPKFAAVPIKVNADGDFVDASLGDVFPADAWQLDKCKRLQTSDGMLLFQEWKQVAPDQWKLWPMTVVIGRGMSNDASGDPIVIDAPEGANIKFTGALDVMSGNAPPIKNGTMVGPVHIYRTTNLDNRSFSLKTANVGIDTRKIWTTEAIEMQVGNARMVGRDLTLNLAAGAAPPGGGMPTAVLDRMELIYLDELVMPLGKDGLWSEEGDTNKKPEALISVRCGGRVTYDFAINYLTLQESVSLIHQVPGMLPDHFDCQKLELMLNDPTNSSLEREGPLDWIREIVASGNPATVKLPSQDAELLGDLIRFNAAEGVLEASGAKGIRVSSGPIMARLARLRYQFNPATPELIGEIRAPGAGIVEVDDPEIPLREARWENGFHLRPIGETTAEQVSQNKISNDVEMWINGNIQAWLTDGGEFHADKIAGVLTPVLKKISKPGAAGSKPTKPKQTFAPKYFDVTGGVRVDTLAILAETNHMKLLFVDESDPQPTPTDPTAEQPASMRQLVTQPTEDEDGMVAPIARQRPRIVGNAINATLRRNVTGLSAKALSVTGDVAVRHEIETGGQMLPALLTGQKLQLIDGGGEDVLELSGGDSPARFELGDGFFEGPQIQIRPSDNVVWINAAGEFQMPTAALPTGLAGESSQNFKWTQPPKCRWLGEMSFNGRSAILTDGVQIDAEVTSSGEPWQLRMTGDRLQVDLAADVAVRNVESVRGAAVESITLVEGPNRPVMVQALQLAGDGVRETKHLIHANKLTLKLSGEGLLVGEGPGWYRGWMRSTAQDSFFGEQPKQKNLRDAADSKLSGVHLVFNHSMQANLTNRNLDFLSGVRVGLRSVDGWEDGFDARQMDAISLGESTMDCDRLRFNVEPGFQRVKRSGQASTPPPWEMEATSGVVYRSRNEQGLFEGTADRAAYSSGKDLFTVSGAANRPAVFRKTMPDGSPGPEGASASLTIRPRTMTIENAVLSRLNIPAPGSNETR